MSAGLVALFAWAACADDATDDEMIEFAEQYQVALETYESGDYNEAFQVSSGLFRRDPINPDVNFVYGMSAMAIGKLSHAVLAFDRVLSAQPENDRARLELARTYTAMGQFGEAQNYFEAVRANNPPPVVQRNIDRYLEEIEKVNRNWQVFGQAAVGFLYDDNVNVGPDSDVIRIRPTLFGVTVLDELAVEEVSKPKEDYGFFGLVDLGGIYDPGISGEWAWLGGGSYYRTWLSDEHNFELENPRGFLGVRHSGERHLFETRARIEHWERGGESLTTIYGLSPHYVYATSETRDLYAHADIEYREYADQDDLDSVYYKLGGTLTQEIPDKKARMIAGLSGIYEDADSPSFTNIGLLAELGASFALPHGFELIVNGAYRYRDYDEPEALAVDSREDHELRAGVGLNKRLRPNMGVTAGYQYTTNDSTFDLYDYEKNVITIGIDYAF